MHDVIRWLRRPLVALVLAPWLASGPAEASQFFATMSLSLDVPLNLPLSYMVFDGDAGSGSVIGFAEGNAFFTHATAGTTNLVLPGLLGAPLDITAGPIGGIAVLPGVVSGASGIVSDTFQIQNLKNEPQTLTLGYVYSFQIVAQKFSGDPGESANARVSFRFVDFESGDESEPFVEEVRLEPEDGPAVLGLICTRCAGAFTINLAAMGLVNIGIIADVQGNAIWIPLPSTGALVVAAALLLHRAGARRRAGAPARQR